MEFTFMPRLFKINQSHQGMITCQSLQELAILTCRDNKQLFSYSVFFDES